MFKKFIGYVCLAAMIISGFTGTYVQGEASAETPQMSSKDESTEHWALQELRKWMEYGVIHGFPDGSLKPDKAITRAEFVVMIDRVFRFGKRSERKFKDVSETAYYSEAVSGAYAAGIVGGTGSNAFEAGKEATRAEVVSLLLAAIRTKG